MLTPQSKQIGLFTYTVIPLGALQGRKVFARLMKLVGPALGALSKDGVEAFGKLFEGLSEDDMDFFCNTFAERTTVNMGAKSPRLSEIFELHFAANYGDMLKWLVFSLQVNFGSFLVGLPGLVDGARSGSESGSDSTKA